MSWVKTAIAVVLVLAVCGCTTMSVINTTPDGASLYVNRQKIGESPTATELSNFVGSSYYLEAEKEGYEDLQVPLEKEVKVGNLIIGLFVWPVLLWCWGPKSAYFFEMEEE